ncbi:MAG: hypothetical protein LUG27_11390 [Clostridiales bacterium]|nr:hypothetical protein [Clostridiales bacterium]
MKNEELFSILKEKFRDIAREHQLSDAEITVHCRALSPEEAIGKTERKDFPILTGRDIMIQAEYDGGIGQAYTCAPVEFSGTLQEILDFDILNNIYDRGIFIAALNAVTRRYGICDRSIHCKNDGPEGCAKKAMEYLVETYGKDMKIAQVGYQPAMLEGLSRTFRQVKVLDLDPANVGDTRFGIYVLDGVKDYEATVLEWADLVLCTSSTLANASIENFLDIGKEVLFYGTTGAGAAALMGWKRLCYAD